MLKPVSAQSSLNFEFSEYFEEPTRPLEHENWKVILSKKVVLQNRNQDWLLDFFSTALADCRFGLSSLSLAWSSIQMKVQCHFVRNLGEWGLRWVSDWAQTHFVSIHLMVFPVVVRSSDTAFLGAGCDEDET